MLLNEFLKEHKRVEEQQRKIAGSYNCHCRKAGEKGMDVLAAQLREQDAKIQR